MLAAYLDQYIPRAELPLSSDSASLIVRTAGLGIKELTFNALKQNDNALLKSIYNPLLQDTLRVFFKSRGFTESHGFKDVSIDYALSLIDTIMASSLTGPTIASPDGDGVAPVTDEAATLIRSAITCTSKIMPFFLLHSLQKKPLKSHLGNSLHSIYLHKPDSDFSQAEYAAAMLLGLNHSSPDDNSFLSIYNLPETVKFNPFISKLGFHGVKRARLEHKLDFVINDKPQYEYAKARTTYFKEKPILQAIEALCPISIEPNFSDEANRFARPQDQLRRAVYYHEASHVLAADAEQLALSRDATLSSITPDGPRPALSLFNAALNKNYQLQNTNTPLHFDISVDAVVKTELSLPQSASSEIKLAVEALKNKVVKKAQLYVGTYEKAEEIASHSLQLGISEQADTFNDLLSVIDFFSDFSQANALRDFRNLNALFINVFKSLDALNAYPFIKRYVNSISNLGAADLINQSDFSDYFASQVLYLRISQNENMELENTYLNTYSIAKLLADAEIKYPGICNNDELLGRFAAHDMNEFFKTKIDAIHYEDAIRIFHSEYNRSKKLMLDKISAPAPSAQADMSFLKPSAL